VASYPSSRFRILARSYVVRDARDGRLRKGRWWVIASFRFRDDAQRYWDRSRVINTCWEQILCDGRDVVDSAAAVEPPSHWLTVEPRGTGGGQCERGDRSHAAGRPD